MNVNENAGKRIRSRGQSTIEYVLMLAFGAIFSLQVANFFNGVFKDGMIQLEKGMEVESKTGQEFVPNN